MPCTSSASTWFDSPPLSRQAFHCDCHFAPHVLWLLCCVKPLGSSLSALFWYNAAMEGVIVCFPKWTFWILEQMNFINDICCISLITFFSRYTKFLQIACVPLSPGRSLYLWQHFCSNKWQHCRVAKTNLWTDCRLEKLSMEHRGQRTNTIHPGPF